MDYLHVQADNPWYNYYIAPGLSPVQVDNPGSTTYSSVYLAHYQIIRANVDRAGIIIRAEAYQNA